MMMMVTPRPMLALLVLAVLGHHIDAFFTFTVKPRNREPDEARMNPAQMIARSGYPAESHLVTTEDGYILTVHRIPPSSPRWAGVGAGHPVFLQHGLLATSADWLIVGPGKALPYMLADLGYDVWLGNARGNTYSRVHRNLSTSDSKFWDFSWHEMGYYDLPAVTEYILQNTGHPDLTYVGHSMGTTMFWVFCTTRPELQHRIRQMHALAPIAFMSRMRSPIRNLAPFVRELQVTLALLGEHEFLPHGAATSFLVQEFLRVNHIAAEGAEYVFFSICGFDPAQFNKTLLPTILGHTPAGASTQTVLHYLQEVKSGKFRQYDEGTEAGNLRRYGVAEPPEYDLSKLEVPVAMQYSLNDWLANTDDVKKLFDKLKNPVGLFQVPLKTFNHLDYMWANDARGLVYDSVVKMMKETPARVRGRLERERLAGDYAAVARYLSPVLRSYNAQLIAFYSALLQRLGPHYQHALKYLQQVNDHHLQEMALQRWGPGMVSNLERLQKYLNTTQTRLQTAAGNKDVKDQGQDHQMTRGDLVPGWYDSVLKQAQTYPSLLAVKSSPLVNRMLSTLQAEIVRQNSTLPGPDPVPEQPDDTTVPEKPKESEHKK